MSDYIVEDIESQQIVNRYRCANCWGHLIRFAVPGPGRLWEIRCPTCENLTGLVSEKWVEKQIQEDAAKLAEVRYNLRGLIVEIEETDPDEILKSLGYDKTGGKK